MAGGMEGIVLGEGAKEQSPLPPPPVPLPQSHFGFYQAVAGRFLPTTPNMRGLGGGLGEGGGTQFPRPSPNSLSNRRLLAKLPKLRYIGGI